MSFSLSVYIYIYILLGFIFLCGSQPVVDKQQPWQVKGLSIIYNTLVRWVSRQADRCQVGYQGTDLTLRFLLTAKKDLQCWCHYPEL